MATNYVGKTIGLRELTWFPLLTDEPDAVPTYGPGIKLSRALMATLTPQMRTAILESDDGIEDDVAQVSGYGLSIDASQINNTVRAGVFGHEIDEDGGLVFNQSDVPAWGALAFRTKLSTESGQAPKYAYHILYKGKFQEFAETFETGKRDSLTFQTHNGIAASFYGLDSTGDIRYLVREDEAGFKAAKVATWFDAPVFKTPVVPAG